jgi:hypothetical protein
LEEILPLNYYSELCGIMVDINIIINFIKKYFPKIKIFNNKMFESSIINFINRGLICLLTNDLSEKTSLLIWDFIFLEGNIVIMKTFLAIINILKKRLLTIKSEEDLIPLKEILDETKKIKEDDLLLLQSLTIRHYEFTSELLDKFRYLSSISLAENLENGNLEQIQCKLRTNYSSKMKTMESKYKNCNKKWPYCLNDTYFETVTNILEYLVINHKNKCNVIENYFFNTVNNTKNDNNENKNNYEEEEEDYYDIALERRPHYCSEIIEEIEKERNINKEEKKNNNDEENKEDNKEENNENNDDNGIFNKIYETIKKTSVIVLSNFNPIPFNENVDDSENK